MKKLKVLAFTALVLTLPACANVHDTVTDTFYRLKDMGAEQAPDAMTGKPLSERVLQEGACPVVEIVPDLGSYYDFGNQVPGAASLVSRADMSTAKVGCSYGPRSVTIDVNLAFDGTIGQAGRQMGRNEAGFSYPYFVAIAAPGGKILAKQVFAVSVAYDAASDKKRYLEGLRQIIPADTKESAAHYKVLVGFQLTQEQLNYNRRLAAQRAKQAADRQIADRKLSKLPPAGTPPKPGPVPQAAAPATTPVITTPAKPRDQYDTGPIILAPDNSGAAKKLND